ncbi:unnamed protein product [Linum trigynum]|uniref:Uncharacterized protein n=1 Tax=Linum trigynum TaxID=586398 RepID=A0AAV2ECQ8_9ROSI
MRRTNRRTWDDGDMQDHYAQHQHQDIGASDSPDITLDATAEQLLVERKAKKFAPVEVRLGMLILDESDDDVTPPILTSIRKGKRGVESR